MGRGRSDGRRSDAGEATCRGRRAALYVGRVRHHTRDAAQPADRRSLVRRPAGSLMALRVSVWTDSGRGRVRRAPVRQGAGTLDAHYAQQRATTTRRDFLATVDRKSLAQGKSVSVSVDLGGRLIHQKTK